MCQTILTGHGDPGKESFMSNPSRRAFVMTVVAGGSALAAARVSAQAAPVLTEVDPQAVALGYRADATKVATPPNKKSPPKRGIFSRLFR